MKTVGILGAIWGLGGFGLMLLYTIKRLTPITIEIFDYDLHWYHWLVLLVNTGVLAYLEGYKGFQKGLSPRMAARAKYMVNNPNILDILLAPFFCIGYFHATKRRIKISFFVTIMIIIFIMIVRLFEQPWRGVVDAGVVVGLSWGLISLIVFSIKAFTSADFNHSPELSE